MCGRGGGLFFWATPSNEQLFRWSRHFMGWLPVSLRPVLNCPFLAKPKSWNICGPVNRVPPPAVPSYALDSALTLVNHLLPASLESLTTQQVNTVTVSCLVGCRGIPFYLLKRYFYYFETIPTELLAALSVTYGHSHLTRIFIDLLLVICQCRVGFN